MLGFCLFNNVALGAEYLIRHYGISRIAIVDLDAHHGNGTQHCFEARRNVLYISLHERLASLPFPGTGESSEIGIGPGEGYTLNIPLERGSREEAYFTAMERIVLPALEGYRPDVLLISAGFDALSGDPLCHLALRPKSYATITRYLTQAADQLTAGRIISVLEGGYDLAQLGPAVAAHVKALLAVGSAENFVGHGSDG